MIQSVRAVNKESVFSLFSRPLESPAPQKRILFFL